MLLLLKRRGRRLDVVAHRPVWEMGAGMNASDFAFLGLKNWKSEASLFRRPGFLRSSAPSSSVVSFSAGVGASGAGAGAAGAGGGGGGGGAGAGAGGAALGTRRLTSLTSSFTSSVSDCTVRVIVLGSCRMAVLMSSAKCGWVAQ